MGVTAEDMQDNVAAQPEEGQQWRETRAPFLSPGKPS